MATSSLLGIDADNRPPAHSATGIDSLGPSDASDSGSDSAGAYSSDTDSDTDRFGTGERTGVEPEPHPLDRDILPDHVESMADADAEPQEELPDDGQPDKDAPLTADDLPDNSGEEENQVNE